jgi:TonB family protein
MITVILESALRTLLLAVIVWAILRVFRVSHVVALKIAWCLVLAAAVAMPSLTRWRMFRFRPPLVLYSYRATWSSTEAQVSATVPKIAGSTLTPAYPTLRTVSATFNPGHRIAAFVHWATIAYLLTCAIFVLRLLLGLNWALRVWRRARPVSELTTSFMTVRSSGDVSTPFTLGFGIVLPSSFNEWDSAKLHIVLAHERSHILQGDFFLQLLAKLHAAIFWFSPAAWWLQKELADLGEAISDHAAISQAPDRYSYAEVLLEFAAMSRRPLAGVAMARSKGISRRINRILNDTLFRRAFMHGRPHIFVAAAIVPVALLVSTSLVVVRAAGSVNGPYGPTGRNATQQPAIGRATPRLPESSEASIANPKIELLTSVNSDEQPVAMQEADLIQEQIKKRWAEGVPRGIHPNALVGGPNSAWQKQVGIEFSVGSSGHISDMVLVHASGQISLDRAAWEALTALDPPPLTPGLPSGNLRYRIAFAYDGRAEEQTSIGLHPQANQYADQPAVAGQNISKSTAAPPPPIYKVGGPVTAPKLVYAPDPEFPGRQGAGGLVVVRCVVDVKGRPKQVVVSRSLSRAFDKSAIHAVEQYRFEPAVFEGKAVTVEVNIEVNFKRY